MRGGWIPIVMVLGAFLVWSEYGSQDMLGRECNNSTPEVSKEDPPKEVIDKTVETLRRQHTIVGWRRALLVALIVTIPLLYLLRGKVTGYDLFIVTTIIFLIVYFSSVWIQARWWGANDLRIERHLLSLRHQCLPLSLSLPQGNILQQKNTLQQKNILRKEDTLQQKKKRVLKLELGAYGRKIRSLVTSRLPRRSRIVPGI